MVNPISILVAGTSLQFNKRAQDPVGDLRIIFLKE